MCMSSEAWIVVEVLWMTAILTHGSWTPTLAT